MLRYDIFSCTCSQVSCYPMTSSLALAPRFHATLWTSSLALAARCHATLWGWRGVITSLHLQTCFMLRYDIFSCTCKHVSCFMQCIDRKCSLFKKMCPRSCATTISSLEMWNGSIRDYVFAFVCCTNCGNANTLNKLADLASTCWDKNVPFFFSNACVAHGC